ncbi:unnamed protein product [Euphydryas editha]|uniref:SAP domain-containing protein n=1 Tax=Euphydryas editha TaxID=104508 RepID=A0AAU9U937_EUPED|nr:unnamed protein product [Euphydryas editha]
MADSTMNDISKMKVIDLRKELKSRGLSYAGDKAELVARLQGAISHDDHGDINLDSDIDSDGVLEDEDDKSQNDILDDTAVDTLNEELALEENSPEKQAVDPKPHRILKRKITTETPKPVENKEGGAKKIILNRTSISQTNMTDALKPKEEKKDIESTDNNTSERTITGKIKITAETDPKTRLEMRAKRFGLPVKMTDEQRKEARKQRFNQNSVSTNNSSINVSSNTGSLADNMEKLKKRAQRFGQSVSAIMTDIENKEKLEKRKAKFGTVKT